LMKKLLPFLTLCVLFASAFTAKAQFSLQIVAPSQFAGVVAGTAPPGTGWGYDPATIAPVRGFCKWASPDTGALLAANVTGPNGVGDMRGKVAVVRRGDILRDIKVRRCERAGAIAVIIINNDAAMPQTVGGADSGALVQIPSIVVPKAWGSQFSALINAGQLEVVMGELRGQFANNLTLPARALFVPNHFALPRKLIYDTTAFRFRVGGRVINLGRNAQSNVVFKAEVRRVTPTPQVLFSDSVVSPSLAVNDSVDINLGIFKLFTAEGGVLPGGAKYELVYTTKSRGVADENPVDNTVIYDFYTTESAFSKCKLNMDAASPTYLTPVFNQGYTVAAAGRPYSGPFKWGYFLRTGFIPDSINAVVKKITFGATTNNAAVTDSMGGQEIEVEVGKWTDINNDGTMSVSEVNLVGSGVYTFTSNRDRGRFFAADVFNVNTGTPGVQLESNSAYVLMASYQGTYTVFLNANDGERNYDRAFRDTTNPDYFIPLTTGAAYGSFRLDIQPSLRVDFDFGVGTKEMAATNTKLHLAPNPSAGHVTCTLDGVLNGIATVRLRDVTGRVMLEQKELLQGANNRFTLDAKVLPPGLYQAEVITTTSSYTAKVMVAR
jgi:hypothetical protein